MQKSAWPDAWALLLAAAWVLAGAAIGFAIVDPSPAPGFATVLAVSAIVVAVIAVSLHRQNA